MMTITQRLANEYKRSFTRFVIEPTGKGYYVENGKLYTRKEFEAMYPVPLTVKSDPKAEDIDGTRRWMQ